jgi:hypothetical protein
MTQNNLPNPAAIPVNPAAKPPNETGSISVEGFVRIFDPANKEIFVEKRA